MSGFCATYDCATFCRFYMVDQQRPCFGFFESSQHGRCVWWKNLGDGRYHCGNPDAQEWARKNLDPAHTES